MWLTKLKIAIVERNTNSISKLLEDIPHLEDKSEIQEAIYLLKEATLMVESLKNKTSSSMKQVRKNLDFLRSTDIPTSKRLDIKS